MKPGCMGTVPKRVDNISTAKIYLHCSRNCVYFDECTTIVGITQKDRFEISDKIRKWYLAGKIDLPKRHLAAIKCK